ncbi:Dna2-domain-containing protein [Punctularia strigosozonata HHB-11173 SS5]|uniref:DNA replication ATP-dependent helicase/nuclease DNA2 n=1 Tax=Punctularia strigosozonata (strain HHB-11173) TaxID=741275 RepID=R7S5M1_PUNST|nr:Dna2-domain-containing protein [Punctularia strigosozonata HHB-11173 SS5]EIN04726.1 Dna2-domain-containing protein [Punctularia strigosozonata HHB-11173 SS5]
MPAPTRTAAEEAAFMSELLSGLDDSFFNSSSPLASPARHSPRKHPKKHHKRSSPAPRPRSTPLSPLSSRSPKKPTHKLENVQAADVDLAALTAGAEDWDWEDMLTPKKSRSPHKSHRDECTRCVVESIDELEQSAIYSTHSSTTQRRVVLHDDWAWTELEKGDVVNVLGSFKSDASGILSVDITSKNNIIIAHPDLLLTATALSNASQCRRKPLLSSLIRQASSESGASPSLVWGNMLHEVVQSCLKEGRWDEGFISSLINGVVRTPSGLSSLVTIGCDVEAAKKELNARAVGIKVFGERYIQQGNPREDAVLVNTRAKNGQKSLLAITALHDVEEDMWSPRWGLKGKIDASVQGVVEERTESPFTKTKMVASASTMTSSPFPFEIKTGRNVAGMEHRAQTMLYTLLMSERRAVESGLLYYTQSEEVVRVPAGRAEIRALLSVRNELAGWMDKRAKAKERDVVQIEDAARFLPETIDDERICKRCYVSDACMLYRRAVEDIEDVSSPIADIYFEKTGHLTVSHREFFKKWEQLISLEERDIVRFKKELWIMGAREREARGRCFADMVLDHAYVPPAAQAHHRIHQFTYRFVKQGGETDEAASLLNGHMGVGDAVTISVEPHLLALSRGFIVELTPTEVILGVDHELHLGRIAARTRTPTPDVLFRIDRDELFGGMSRVRDNLAHLFYQDGDKRRLGLVVDLKTPQFDWPDVEEDDEVEVLDDAYAKALEGMNPNQREAMDKVMAAQDYALILGMPGTGKTTVIVALIKELVRRGKTVLLTSYTHSAVDTILLKLLDAEFGILRLGNVDKVHRDVHKFTLAARKEANSVEELEKQMMTPPVVATTCLSIEQSDAKKGGFDVSLFRRLSDAHPHAVTDLAFQYRMNEDIMTLSNKLIYSDRLRCGSKEVAKRALILPRREQLTAMHKSSCGNSTCWIEHLLAESCKAVFVDTDLVPARDSKVGDLVQNEVEAELVYQTVRSLLAGGVREDQIGVISLYRQQIKLLSHLLQDHSGIEILTADRSQGRDKDCIIISMVKSNESGAVGELVKDWRRVNVSVTRARSKLIIFGSRSTLQSAPLLNEFFMLMADRKWIYNLPPGAHQMHRSLIPLTTRKRSSNVALLSEADPHSDRHEAKSNACSPKRARLDPRIIDARPLLKDLVNDI